MNRVCFILLLSLTGCSLTGCAMISYDRVLPTFTWAWTDAAKEQRRQNRERKEGEKAYERSLKTNTVQQIKPNIKIQ